MRSAKADLAQLLRRIHSPIQSSPKNPIALDFADTWMTLKSMLFKLQKGIFLVKEPVHNFPPRLNARAPSLLQGPDV